MTSLSSPAMRTNHRRSSPSARSTARTAGCRSANAASHPSMSASSRASAASSSGRSPASLGERLSRPRRGRALLDEIGVEAAQPGGREAPRNRRVRPPAARPIAAAPSGSSISATRPGAKRSGCRPSTSKPVTPSWTTLSSPPTALATHGMPHAAASRATRPKLSRGSARSRRRRRGSSSTAGGAAWARRTRRARRHRASPGERLADQLGVAVGAAGTADEDEYGVVSVQHGEGERHVGPLQRLDPPDEQEIGRSAEKPMARRAPPVTGAKKACSTAGGTISITPGGSP